MLKIFVSGRGSDTQAVTRRIIDRIDEVGGDRMTCFWPRGGRPEQAATRGELQAADVALIVIGAEWIAGVRAERDPGGVEASLALARNIPVIPVLIRPTDMPSSQMLPDEVRNLAYHNGVSIDPDGDFDRDVDRLIRALDSLGRARLSTGPAAAAQEAKSAAPSAASNHAAPASHAAPLPIAALMRKRQQREAEVRRNARSRGPAPPDRVSSPDHTPASGQRSRPEPRPVAAQARPPRVSAAQTLGGLKWPLLLGAAAVVAAAGYIWRHDLAIAAGGLLKLLGLAAAPVPTIPAPDAAAVRDLVDASAFAPASGRGGEDVMVQIFLHATPDAAAAAALAQEADPDTSRRGITTLAVEVSRGQRVDIVLDAGPLVVDEPSQSLIWRGEPRACQFVLTLTPDQAGRSCAVKARVLVESVPVGVLRFSLKVNAAQPTAALDLVGEAAHRYRHAFLSHSHDDRTKVLTYAQLLDAVGIKYFQDIASLRAMEQWERRLHQAIDACDLFLLFWTTSAARSEWVERETRYALERQTESDNDLPDIMPVFLDADSPQPPEWLKSRHFDSILRLAMRGAEAERHRE
jgi:hypothetical protein